MSKAKYDIAPQYLRAEKTRQRFLDFFIENPGSLGSDVVSYMTSTFDDARNPSNTLRQMLALGELRATKNSRVWRYFATATVTTSAKVFSLKQRTAARRRMNERHGNEPEHREHEETPPWKYIHRPGHYNNVTGHVQGKPLSNQEAIGTSRQRVYVGASI